MEKIGVEAVVTGLASFLGDMDKMDNSIKKLGPAGTLLSNVFDAVKSVVISFGESIVHVAEYALGQLLADAIRGVLSLLSDLASGVLDSADTFQKLEIRLQRLNFNDAKNSGMEYNAAMEQAIRLTKEQIDWTIKLGAQTPYDASDIANIYTLARGYGFSAEEAKLLTEATIEFTAGMGLSNVEMERIIINFGQLSQQGKLNGQDIRDLARGAYVPVNRVLEMTAQKLGLTREEFDKMRRAGTLSAEAVDAFRESFVELVGVDFTGAAEAFGDVFSVAVENIKALIQDMLGLNVVKPILLEIGKYLQDITFAIAGNDDRWKRFQDSIKSIGATILEIITGLLGLAPSADSVAESVTVAMEKIAKWFADNKDNIIAWVQNVAKKVGAFIDKVVEVWNKLSAWVTENKPLIEKFFKSLGEIIGDVFGNLFGGGEIDFSLEGVLESLKKFMTWVTENKDQIAEWITWIAKAAAAFFVLSAVIEVIWAVFVAAFTAIAAIVLFALGVVLFFSSGVGAVVTAVVVAIGILAAFIAAFVVGFIAGFLQIGKGIEEWATNTLLTINVWVFQTMETFLAWGESVKLSIEEWKESIIWKFLEWKSSVIQTILNWANETKTRFIEWVVAVKAKFVEWKNYIIQSVVSWASETKAKFLNWVSEIKNINWLSIGIAIVEGIKNGILSMGSSLIDTVVQLGIDAYNALKNALGVGSPSKLFAKIGYSIDEGLINGILGAAKEVGSAMQSVMGEISAPAMQAVAGGAAASSTTSNSYTSTYNYNLSIASSANAEPILQDFEMMRSLAG